MKLLWRTAPAHLGLCCAAAITEDDLLASAKSVGVMSREKLSAINLKKWSDSGMRCLMAAFVDEYRVPENSVV
ncbi:hypothetical protein [Sphingobium sp.]|uniref:hypothetical protein n=1 Tax=Sphingobium sp. TaxID=1912891 RepID=UPI00257BB6C3|nr:hypothetical protein [Sphingobium sp.]